VSVLKRILLQKFGFVKYKSVQDCLTFEDRTDRLSLNVGNKLPI